ncbi:unnamed protein product [Priceomyces carsonii]|nr:unnamed protein product [Priceomyces carsonii]
MIFIIIYFIYISLLYIR